jgi:hypothetical protein
LIVSLAILLPGFSLQVNDANEVQVWWTGRQTGGRMGIKLDNEHKIRVMQKEKAR